MMLNHNYEFYSICQSTKIYNHKSAISGHDAHESFPNKGVIHLCLDMVQRKLSFEIDNIEEKYKGEHMIAEQINVEDNQFYLAIAMYATKGNGVELINFEAIQK